MTLSDFATLSTAISGLAVTASLIYLAMQTHQNAKHTKALIQQGRTARMTEVLLGQSRADLASALIKAQGGTPDADSIAKYQYAIWCAALMVGFEDTFCQHEESLISEERFRSHRPNVVMAFGQSAFRRYWETWKAARPDTLEKFKVWMDEIAAQTPVTSIDARLESIFSPTAESATDRTD